MEPLVAVAGEGERFEGCGRDFDPELLAELAHKGILGSLAVLNLASWELPESRQFLSSRAFRHQDAARPIDQGRCRHHYEAQLPGHEPRPWAFSLKDT